MSTYDRSRHTFTFFWDSDTNILHEEDATGREALEIALTGEQVKKISRALAKGLSYTLRRFAEGARVFVASETSTTRKLTELEIKNAIRQHVLGRKVLEVKEMASKHVRFFVDQDGNAYSIHKQAPLRIRRIKGKYIHIDDTYLPITKAHQALFPPARHHELESMRKRSTFALLQVVHEIASGFYRGRDLVEASEGGVSHEHTRNLMRGRLPGSRAIRMAILKARGRVLLREGLENKRFLRPPPSADDDSPFSLSTERVRRILEQSSQPISQYELQQHLKLGERQIRRCLKLLDDNGVTVNREKRGSHTFYSLYPSLRRPPVPSVHVDLVAIEETLGVLKDYPDTPSIKRMRWALETALGRHLLDGRKEYPGVIRAKSKRETYYCDTAINMKRPWLGRWPTAYLAAGAIDAACLYYGLPKRHGTEAVATSPEVLVEEAWRSMRRAYPDLLYEGVTLAKGKEYLPYRSRLSIDKKMTNLGYWPTEKLAAQARDAVAKHIGSKARLSFPRTKPRSLEHVLQLAAYVRNRRRTSRFSGVYIDSSKLFRPGLHHKGKWIHGGVFKDEEVAARIRDAMVRHYRPGQPNEYNFEGDQALSTGEAMHVSRTLRAMDRDLTSAYRGVYWNSEREAWVAQIETQDGKRTTHFLGAFFEEAEAALAYNEAAIEWQDRLITKPKLNIL